MKPLLYSLPGQRMKLSEEDKKRLVQLDQEYGRLQKLFRFSWNYNHPTNVDEQYEQFIKAYNNGIEYYPILRTDKDLDAMKGCKDGFMRLASQFQKFNCFLSKYYIQRCIEFSHRAEFAMDPAKHAAWFTSMMNQEPTTEETKIAKELLKTHPYKKPNKSTPKRHLSSVKRKWRSMMDLIVR